MCEHNDSKESQERVVKSKVELDNSEAHKDRKDNWDIYQN